jgi:hypothetical protein
MTTAEYLKKKNIAAPSALNAGTAAKLSEYGIDVNNINQVGTYGTNV